MNKMLLAGLALSLVTALYAHASDRPIRKEEIVEHRRPCSPRPHEWSECPPSRPYESWRDDCLSRHHHGWSECPPPRPYEIVKDGCFPRPRPPCVQHPHRPWIVS